MYEEVEEEWEKEDEEKKSIVILVSSHIFKPLVQLMSI
jgi:hypothetical protein